MEFTTAELKVSKEKVEMEELVENEVIIKKTFKNRAKRNKLQDNIFKYWAIFCTFIGLFLLLIFIGDILVDGLSRLSWDFIVSLPSRRPAKAGIFTAMLGSLWMLGLTALFSFPLGVSAGIYLEEYGKKSKWSSFSA